MDEEFIGLGLDAEDLEFDFGSAFESYLSNDSLGGYDSLSEEYDALEEYQASFEQGYQDALEAHDVLLEMEREIFEATGGDTDFQFSDSFVLENMYEGYTQDSAFEAGYNDCINDFT